mgnify:CR=1 FL=1
MSWNLPDDWSSYYSTCSACGERYHASGCDECACIRCSECGESKPPDDMGEDETCADCENEDPWEGWDDELATRLSLAGYVPDTDIATKTISKKVRTARKDHGDRIKAGDRYQEHVWREVGQDGCSATRRYRMAL